MYIFFSIYFFGLAFRGGDKGAFSPLSPPPQWAILEKFVQKLIFEFKVVVKIIKVASRYIFFTFATSNLKNKKPNFT